MNRYTIYCTEEQTKKALELGAKIEFDSHSHGRPHIQDGCNFILLPTAEQMIGWLESQKVYINFDTTSEEGENSNFIITWQYFIYNRYHDSINEEFVEYSSRPEATLAAIDAALDYLIKNKK